MKNANIRKFQFFLLNSKKTLVYPITGIPDDRLEATPVYQERDCTEMRGEAPEKNVT